MSISELLPEFPVSAEEDKDLMNYFINLPYIQDLVSTNKWMVLGRKGTGKTAIYEYFRSPKIVNNNVFSININFKDYPWPIHKLYKESMEGESSAYSRSWKYLIYSKLVADLVSRYDADGLKIDKNLGNARKLLTQIYGRPNPTVSELIRNKLTRVQALTLPVLQSGNVNISGGDIAFEDVAEDKKLLMLLKSNAFSLDNVNIFSHICGGILVW